MEYLKLDFDEFFASEFGEPNSPNNQGTSNNILSLKKRIILTDELLGKFSEALAENEQLRAEKNVNLEQLQNYRQRLFTHLSSKEDWEKKYEQLEERLLYVQKQLDIQINIVAARDSIVRQYECLTKENERQIKELKAENDGLKKQNNTSEEKSLRRKYNVKLKQWRELSEIIKKLQTCSACQKLKSSKDVKKKQQNENDLDLGSFSPDNGIPASVCSMDTGFESNLSDSDSDLESVSQKIIPKSADMVNNDKETFLRTDEPCGAEKIVNEKLCDNSATLSSKKIDTKYDKKMNGNENSDDKRLRQLSMNSENLLSTFCANCLKNEKVVAEKYVQTKIVKYVDSYTEVDFDVVCKGTQTVETEAVSDRRCVVLSRSTQTISVTSQSEQHVSTVTQVQTETNLKSNIPFPNKQTLKNDVTEAQGKGKLLLQADVGCQTEEESKLKLFKEQSVNTDDDLLPFDTDFRESLSPVPDPLSPLPPSPLDDFSENEMDDTVMSDSSLSLNEESTVDDVVDQSSVKVIQFSESATQTEGVCCSCKQQRKNSYLDAATQCNFDPENNSTGSKNKANKITVNKYAKKHKEQTSTLSVWGCVSPTKITDVDDGEKFWRKLILWLIADDGKDFAEKQRIINLLRERNDFLTSEQSGNSGSEIHSHLGQIMFRRKSEDFQQGLHRCILSDSLPLDCSSVKPIVVEMNSNPRIQKSVQNGEFPFDCHQNLRNSDSEDGCESVDDGKSRKSERYPHLKRTDREKILKSKTSMFSPCKKKYKRVTRCSLKRKLSSSEQISNSPSGVFTVSSLHEYDRGRELNEQFIFSQPHNKSLGGFNIESDGHKSFDELDIATNEQTSDTSEMVLYDVTSNIIPLANSISNVTNSNSVKASSLKTSSTLTKEKLSSCLNLVEKGIPSSSSVTNTFSSVAKLGLCASYNVRPLDDKSDPQFETSENNYEEHQVPEHDMMISTNLCNQALRNCNEISTYLKNQPIAVLQSVGQLVKGSCSEQLSSSQLSQSSKGSFHSCDTFVSFQAEQIKDSLQDKLNFVDDEQVASCDEDDKCSPAKIRRLPSSNGDISYASSNVDKLLDRTAYNFSDSLPKNTKSQGKFSGSQHDMHTIDQRNYNNPLLYKTEVCSAQNKNLKEVTENLLHPLDKNPPSRRRSSNSSNNSISNISFGKNITFSKVNHSVEEIAIVKDKVDKIVEEDENCTSPLSQSISHGCVRSEKVNKGDNKYISSDEDDDNYHKDDENEDDENSDHSCGSNNNTHNIIEEQNKNLKEVNENLLHPIDKNSSNRRRSSSNSSNSSISNISLGKNITSSQVNHAPEEIAIVKDKVDKIAGDDENCASPPLQNQSQSVSYGCVRSEKVNNDDNIYISSDEDDNYHKEVEYEDNENSDHSYGSNNNTHNIMEKQNTQNVENCLELSSDKSGCESVSKNNFSEVSPRNLQSNKISSSSNLQKSSSQESVSYNSKTKTSNSESQEKGFKSFYKSSNIAGEITSCAKEIVNIPSNGTLPYRKYCESTIKELVVVKPPPVENEIARKNMIRDTVIAKRLLIPAKAKKLVKESKAIDTSQTSNKEKNLEKQSLGSLNESSPFCRQGMTGRRKIVRTSFATCNSEASINPENSESSSYSELTKKHQRIAHMPKKDLTFNKRICEESSCDETPQKTAEHQADVLQRSCQKPPRKKTKLQKLKQQYISQRRLIRGSASDKNCLKQTINKSETDCTRRTKCEESVDVNVSGRSPSLQDIALDMMLSDSDESTNGKNQGERQHTNIVEHCILQRRHFRGSASDKSCLKPTLNESDSDCTGQTKCEESSVVNIPTLQDIACDMTLSDSDESTSGKYQGERQYTNIVENLISSFGKEGVDIEEGNKMANNQFQLACHSKQDSRNLLLGKNHFIKGTQTSLGSIIKEQKYENQEVRCSSSKFCQINDTWEIESTNDKDIERIDPEDEVNSDTVLESPLSPPDISCEIDFQGPITIPTSPVNTGASENEDVTSIAPDVIGQEVKNVVVEGTWLGYSSNTENEGKEKIKLCPGSEQLNYRPKGSQEPNMFQKFFEHHSKELKAIEKNASNKQKLKNYSDKKKKMELPFNIYLEEEFTEMSLTKIVEDCKKIVKGDYSIIVKHVVKHCRYSSAEACDFTVNFPLSPTQRRLFALVLKLENDHPTIINEVLERITYVVCNKRHHQSMPTLRCLARFFTAFCKMRNYKEKAQIFCYDALFCLKVHAYTVLLAVLTAFPECFPNATSRAGNSLIVRAMVYCIFKYGSNEYSDTKNLRSFMTDFFSYKFETVADFENVEYFVKEIKRGGLPELELAILLVVKFKANWSWTYGKLIKNSLLPTFESWREGLVSENSAAWCIKLCAYLAKTPPFEKPDVCDLLTLLGNYLNLETTPSVIKEACVFSVAALVHINEMKVLTILKKCETGNCLENSKCLQDVLQVVLKKRGMKWWSKFFFRHVEIDKKKMKKKNKRSGWKLNSGHEVSVLNKV
ncbi:hypothetical protein R5R35_000271 [Gryllus longicercus]|uniref:Uncharacterized protein n=1 Tax=Gryllus longicercus TaxID=2509291 RepID=A0AAN9Z8I1_9ORTH